MVEDLFGTSLLDQIFYYVLLFYLFFLSWKHVLVSRDDLRAIGFASGMFLLPALFFASLTQGSDLFNTTACYNDAARWWNFPLKGADSDAPKTLNIISGILLLSSLYIFITAAVNLASYFHARHRGGHLHALHKVLITWGVVLLGLIAFLKVNDVNLTPLLFGMGVLSIVLGLALQDPLVNLFAGIALDLEGTIKREEWIRISGEADTIGKVVDKGWRTTHLLTIDNELVTLPNRLVAGQKILNYHRPETLHVHSLNVNAAPSAPPIKVKEVLRTLLRREPNIANDPPPEARVINYGENSIDYQLRFWVTDYGESNRIKDMLLTQIWYAFRTNQIELSTPVRLVHDQSPAQIADERSQLDDETRKLADFLRTVPPLNSYLHRQDFEFMALNACRLVYPAGEHVLLKGGDGDAMFFVQEGSCNVILPTGDKQLGPGNYVGEMSMLRNDKRNTDVVAGPAGSTMIRIGQACMETLFRYYPALRQEFTKTSDTRQLEICAGQVSSKETPPPFWGWSWKGLRRYLVPW